MTCCDRDGYLGYLRFLRAACLLFGFNRAADWFADRKREAILLRHPWIGGNKWIPVSYKVDEGK